MRIPNKIRRWLGVEPARKDDWRFEPGQRVTIDTKGTRHEYDNKEGIILQTHRTDIQWQSDRSHRFYQVRIDAELDAGLCHVQYFSESELDWTLQDRRQKRLDELGI